MINQIESFSEMPWQQVSDLARQKLIDNGEKRVRLLDLHAGFQEPEWCKRGHTGYIIDGTLHIEFDGGRVQSYAAGEPLLISSGQSHKARVIEGRVQLFLVDEV
jgi:quercetin dioxygenase-like cupin family protein